MVFIAVIYVLYLNHIFSAFMSLCIGFHCLWPDAGLTLIAIHKGFSMRAHTGHDAVGNSVLAFPIRGGHYLKMWPISLILIIENCLL